MSQRVMANINAHVLVWARQTAGYDINEAAHKIGVKPEKLQAWEAGEDKPNMRQLRDIARVYKRPSALFFRSTTPIEPPKIPDFRLLPDADLRYTPRLLYEIRRAFERRTIALDLTAQMGDKPINFPLQASISESPVDLAYLIREVLGITLEIQYSWKDHYTALRSWISAVESLGVLVFHIKNVELKHIRGFSISERPFPVVGINSKDSPRGRIFTLLHELSHIALQNGGLCDLHELESDNDESIETYCNRVAGEVLVPKTALLREDTVINNTGKTVWEDWQLKQLANRYMVSQEVVLRRLLTFSKTTRQFYNQKHEEYEEIYQRERAESGGRVPYYRLILRDNGPAFTSLVLSAYQNEAISSRDLSNFLGGIKLDHVEKIEHALMSGEGGVEA